jgi:predicted HAD superfamily Cof-like phosphohydrolase
MPDSDFFSRVQAFNRMYGLPTPNTPTIGHVVDLRNRLVDFKRILTEEVNEVDEIILAIEQRKSPEEILTMLADWLGDVVVYASSEALRHGIPIRTVLDIIMDSNASKLGEDGKPIIRDGKVQKGPNYWKPEPKIQDLITFMRNYE